MPNFVVDSKSLVVVECLERVEVSARVEVPVIDTVLVGDGCIEAVVVGCSGHFSESGKAI